MQCKDIQDAHVVELARRWHQDHHENGVVMALMAEGIPEKLALRKVESLVKKGLLEYGSSPYGAWPKED